MKVTDEFLLALVRASMNYRMSQGRKYPADAERMIVAKMHEVCMVNKKELIDRLETACIETEL